MWKYDVTRFRIGENWFISFSGLTPRKDEQALQGMELQEK